ncbi:hypothetical protein CJA_3230 [Cellvibrio japonicus Ueda107]|uniref:Uncharacterized protein n=1 Tax=Cellvibrio japonicus (strain Ueda107) TaxID=498211 RepID=B3PEC8_CELJU|nr:hypothetical protein CJA_3230 [Cellvibrio japonicus Ueda107]
MRNLLIELAMPNHVSFQAKWTDRNESQVFCQ